MKKRTVAVGRKHDESTLPASSEDPDSPARATHDADNAPVGGDRLVLVVGSHCHLCDHGRAVLSAIGITAREVGVDSDEAAGLAARGIPLAFLPVLTDGDRVIAYGRLSERRLAKEFRG